MFARCPWTEKAGFDCICQAPPTQQQPPDSANLKSTEPNIRYRGRIKWFSSIRHFGFIIVDQTKEEIFFHQSNIHGIFSPALTPNFPVSFMIRLTPRGPEAVNVRPAEEIENVEYSQTIRMESGPQQDTPRLILKLPSGLHHRRPESRPIRRFRCYNCGQYASHKAAFCPMEPMRKCCYRCRSSTHLLAECPLQPLSFLQPQTFLGLPALGTTEASTNEIATEHRSPVLRKL